MDRRGRRLPLAGIHEELAARKRELRVLQAAARDRLTREERSRLSGAACDHARTWIHSAGLSSIMAYVSFRSELDTTSLITAVWESQFELLLPRVIPDSGTMTVQRVHSWADLSAGTYGILEPSAAGEAAEDMFSGKHPVAVFVPGLAFDGQGGRLGYGRGYYDRLRALWDSRTPKGGIRPVWVGLAYEMQLVQEVPMDEHDGVMDMLITENGVLHCRRPAGYI